MKNNLLFFTFFCLGFFGGSQTRLMFQYDEAGNQVTRSASLASPGVLPSPAEQQAAAPTETEESLFWKGIRLYPVPVKYVLTADWSEDNDAKIDYISLHQVSSMAQVYSQTNSSSLGRKLEINMASLYIGVYTLSFHLKNGKTISKNIIKE